jgi:hypothetical protein
MILFVFRRKERHPIIKLPSGYFSQNKFHAYTLFESTNVDPPLPRGEASTVMIFAPYQTWLALWKSCLQSRLRGLHCKTKAVSFCGNSLLKFIALSNSERNRAAVPHRCAGFALRRKSAPKRIVLRQNLPNRADRPN